MIFSLYLFFSLTSKRELWWMKYVSEIVLNCSRPYTYTDCLLPVPTRATKNRDGQVKEKDLEGGERHAHPWDLRIPT